MGKKKIERRELSAQDARSVERVSPEERNHVLDRLTRRIREKSPNGHRIEVFDDLELMNNLRQANELYGRNLPGEARSTRPVWGRLLTLVKSSIKRLTGWYVEPALDKQRLFNAYTVRSINEIKAYLDHLQINEDILSTIVHRDLALFRANLIYLNKYLDRRLQELGEKIDLIEESELEQLIESGSETPRSGDGRDKLSWEGLTDTDTLFVEQSINGTTREVSQRQSHYLPYFRDRENSLVLGSGRGEFMGLLARENIKCQGLDWSTTMVDYCQDKDYPVDRARPLEYLERLEDGYIHGVLITHRVLANRPYELVKMMGLCYQKIAGGGVIVVEGARQVPGGSLSTPKVHAETLMAICERCGFEGAEMVDLSQNGGKNGLVRLSCDILGSVSSNGEKELFLQVEENFRRLEDYLASSDNYAVAAFKGDREGAP